MTQLLSGAIMMACWVVGLFFLRFWNRTHDRLFAIFSLAFGIMGLERLLLGFHHTPNEAHPGLYVIRLTAFVLIIIGIVDKNRSKKPN